jgi:hypothetical protein
MKSILLLLFISGIQAFSVISINLIIKRTVEESLISFIKLPHIQNLKIKNSSNYLILNYLDEPLPKTKLDFKLPSNQILIKDDDNKVLNFLSNKEETIEEIENSQNKYLEQYNSFYTIYETIKNNKKPIMIISKKKDSKYLYLIKSKNEYIMKYTFNYNNKHHKYYFDILAQPIDNYETSWEISALIKDYSPNKTLALIGFYIKNWIELNIYNNHLNSFYKRYIILYYFLNLQQGFKE